MAIEDLPMEFGAIALSLATAIIVTTGAVKFVAR